LTHSLPAPLISLTDTAPTEIYTLSLHDALPIWLPGGAHPGRGARARPDLRRARRRPGREVRVRAGRPARRRGAAAADGGDLGHRRLPAPPAVGVRGRARGVRPRAAPAARRPPPHEPDRGGQAREVARALRPVLARGLHAR